MIKKYIEIERRISVGSDVKEYIVTRWYFFGILIYEESKRIALA